ncbi:helix-turn-helix transcriptional regulator [Ligilactobacillus salivarius]|uniref:helix-turn-helix transcriptional regulator n=1 Tax=Ligilactobacillus salivarius TaxID=1624 RepID=UPI003993A507
MTDELLAQLMQLRSDDLTMKEIAKQLGISYRQIRWAFEKINKAKHTEAVNSSTKKITKKTIKKSTKTPIVSSSAFVTVKNGQKMSEKDILKAHSLDPDRFIITSCVSNKWGCPAKVKVSYQTKITVKPVSYSINDVINSINSSVKPLRSGNKHHFKEAHNTLIIPLFDMYFGINSYEAMRTYLDQIEDAVLRGFNSVLIILGDDYFLSDSVTTSKTVKGTQLDQIDMSKAISDGSRFFTELLDYIINKTNHTVVLSVPGNHDAGLAYVWSVGMKRRYQYLVDYFEITTNNWTAFNVDKCGFLVADGYVAKSRLSMLFANDAKDIWSKTDYHACFWGYSPQKKSD